MDWQAIPGMVLLQTGGSDFINYARKEWPELALPWDDVSKAIDISCRATDLRHEFKAAYQKWYETLVQGSQTRNQVMKTKGALRESTDQLEKSMEQLKGNIPNAHKEHPLTQLIRDELDAVRSMSNRTLASNDPLPYAPSCPANRRPSRTYTGMDDPILLADFAIIDHHVGLGLPPESADMALGRLKAKGGDMLYDALRRNVKLGVISVAASDAFPETDKDASMLVALRRLVNLEFKHYNEVEETLSQLVQRFGGGKNTD
ncbi:hypothetical protein N7481_012965 [Penicillium waksmanii]|uniref:uncharacterized protein n=1 Tax=Penicillium waksmanii TaxID=69791 RepID=UPI002546DAE0|nr:uncharacterized protein N7481_012965 [Penicillium waksmanii]KAJ5966251.1 hypothetical protein N7481_012965 [Penicillium waksmanii]